MIVIQPQMRGLSAIAQPSSMYSRVLGVPGGMTVVDRAQRMAGSARLSITSAGMGSTDVFSAVPTWAWTSGAGLILGVVVGAFVFKKR